MPVSVKEKTVLILIQCLFPEELVSGIITQSFYSSKCFLMCCLDFFFITIFCVCLFCIKEKSLIKSSCLISSGNPLAGSKVSHLKQKNKLFVFKAPDIKCKLQKEPRTDLFSSSFIPVTRPPCSLVSGCS